MSRSPNKVAPASLFSLGLAEFATTSVTGGSTTAESLKMSRIPSASSQASFHPSSENGGAGGGSSTRSMSTKFASHSAAKFKPQLIVNSWLFFYSEETGIDFQDYLTSSRIQAFYYSSRTTCYMIIFALLLRIIIFPIMYLLENEDCDEVQWLLTGLSLAVTALAIATNLLTMSLESCLRISMQFGDEIMFCMNMFTFALVCVALCILQKYDILHWDALEAEGHVSLAEANGYSQKNGFDNFMITTELLLFLLSSPMLLHLGLNGCRWIYVGLSLFLALGASIASIIVLEVYTPFIYIGGLFFLIGSQIFERQKERIRNFMTNSKLYEATNNTKEVSTHIQNQEKDVVNLRHIVANTAHDLKTVRNGSLFYTYLYCIFLMIFLFLCNSL